MKIVIETKGTGTETRIWINGVEETKLKFFEFSVNVNYSNKDKLIMVKLVDGRYMPLEYYGEGLRKFDEAEIDKGASDGKHLGIEAQAR
jgi:hypothetical protein